MTSFHSDIFLHRDKTFMPQNPAAWSAWNFLGTMDSKLCLTYWLNVLQVHYLYQFYLSESFSMIFVCCIHIRDNIQMVPWCLSLQNIEETNLPYLVTLNPPHQPQNVLLKWRTGHPVPSVAATKASLDLGNIQGTRGIWFCGAYQGIV